MRLPGRERRQLPQRPGERRFRILQVGLNKSALVVDVALVALMEQALADNIGFQDGAHVAGGGGIAAEGDDSATLLHADGDFAGDAEVAVELPVGVIVPGAEGGSA